MRIIHVPEQLWASTMAPAGILERWRTHAGAHVRPGEVIAEVRVEGALHELAAPSGGRLSISARPGEVIEPGTAIGEIRDDG